MHFRFCAEGVVGDVVGHSGHFLLTKFDNFELNVEQNLHELQVFTYTTL